MKFLCDEMLDRLGRYLRAAGHDTVIAVASTPDQELFRHAKEEGRFLITRDRHFTEFAGAEEIVIFLSGNDVGECAAQLGEQVDIDWLESPFSRCLLCNATLEPATAKQAEQAPDDVRTRTTEYWHCPDCDRLYWEGSHTERMRRKLRLWQSNCSEGR